MRHILRTKTNKKTLDKVYITNVIRNQDFQYKRKEHEESKKQKLYKPNSELQISV